MEKLNKPKLFEVLKQNLPKKYSSDINIIEFKDGIIYAWNAADSSILTHNIEFQLKHSKEYPIQTLRFTNAPVFEVESLLLNKTSSYCALIGSKGVAIARIPRRWGPDGIFENGKEDIITKCTTLDERYFSCKSFKIVKRVRWHPASPNASHLVVLTTEDTLRLYDVQNSTLVTVWHPGRAYLSSSLTQQSTVTHGMQTLASLGETAIDFDFSPPVLELNRRAKKMYNFTPTLKETLVYGKRASNPFFERLVKRSSDRSAPFFVTEKILAKMTEPKEKIPRMHSFYIPQYLKLRQWQREAAVDNGVRLYMKWPGSKIPVIVAVVATACSAVYTARTMYILLKENR